MIVMARNYDNGKKNLFKIVYITLNKEYDNIGNKQWLCYMTHC